MSISTSMDPNQKALEINLNSKIYGTFAEIGAGQEVARFFFRAGGAAGTVAKTMSAYDMIFSDSIYGKSSRYVSDERLMTMLKYEMDLLQERLGPKRGNETQFFAFADTVAAKSFKGSGDCHGWLGVRFQHEVKAAPSEVIIHIRMLDKINLQQQEALGIVGVNLLYACFYYSNNREKFIVSLMDHLGVDRIEIDMITVHGPAFANVDSRLWSLELVKRDFSRAVLFNEKGEVINVKDELYRKHILTCRGSYRPPTLVNIDMLKKGADAFKQDLKCKDEELIVLPEISMNKLRERGGDVDSEDFLARVDLLKEINYPVLISNYQNYSDLSQFLSSNTKMYIGFVFGYYNLIEIFDEGRYANHASGLLGGIGELMGQRGKFYCYPGHDDEKKSILMLKDAPVTKEVRPLIDFLISRNLLSDLKNYNKDVFHIWSRTVLKMIQNGETGWEEMVPPGIAKLVKERCLFGYPCKV
ncbi:MAG: hypothetical protein OHK0056_20390 [Bacteriovoracaceae bacterium]